MIYNRKPCVLRLSIVIGLSFGTACRPEADNGEARSSALSGPTNPTAYIQQLLVPGYFGPSSASGIELKASTYPGFVVANFDSGPGTQADSSDATWIEALHGQGLIVLGYVNNSYPRPFTFITQDISNWVSWYGVDGIFFDVSERPVGTSEILNNGTALAMDIAQTAYLQQYVLGAIKEANPSSAGTVAFNWGTTADQQQQYVYCSEVLSGSSGQPSMFGTFEDTEAAFQNSTPPAWVTQFQPTTFFQIVHTADFSGSNLSSDMAWSREAWNAAAIYVTDQSRYSVLPGYGTPSVPADWTSEMSQANSGAMNDYPGNTAVTAFTCPSPAALAVPYWYYADLGGVLM